MRDKKITTGELKVSAEFTVQRILDISIENKANEHGRMKLKLEAFEDTELSDILRIKGTYITVFIPENIILFEGQCVDVMYGSQSDYKTINITAYSNTYELDLKANTQTFQSPSKRLEDIVKEILYRNNTTYRLKNNPYISQMIYQQNETDWGFLCRLANCYNQQIYVNSLSRHKDIAIGTCGMGSYSMEVLGSHISRQKNISEQRHIMLNTDHSAASYQFETDEYMCNKLTVIPGDTIGYYTVRANKLINNGGILENRVIVQRTTEIRPDYACLSDMFNISSVLNGKVSNVDENNIEILFDADATDMTGNCVSVPYESYISNSFYCMPDIGDEVFVYYENNGNIVCLGSRHSNPDSPDYAIPEEKVLTSYDKMVRLTSKAVKLTDTRKRHDEEDDTEISLILDDDDGITITSGSDIKIETTEKNIRMGAGVSDEFFTKKMGSFENKAVIDGKMKFVANSTEGRILYGLGNKLSKSEIEEKADDIEWERFCGKFNKSLEEAIDGLTFKDMRDAIRAGYFPNDNNEEVVENESEPEPQEEQYDTGVFTIYGLNSVSLQVQDSVIILDSDIYIGSDNFEWLGYDKGTHDIAEAEYQDWFGVALDGLQLALDIAGFFPVVGPICDVINAGISIARGDYVGGAMSLLAAIPGIGDACAAGKMGAKALNAANKIKNGITKLENVYKVVKFIYKCTNSKAYKVIKIIYNGLDAVNQGVGAFNSIMELNDEDGFDFNSAKDWSKLFEIARSFAGIAGDFKDIHETIGSFSGTGRNSGNDNNGDNTNVDNTNADNPAPVNDRTNDGPENSRAESQTTSDPINVITGSLTAEYVDLSIEDVLGAFSLKRCYESAYKNTKGMLGDKWRYEIESSVNVNGEYAVVQMPDLHLEKFRKQNGKWNSTRQGDNSYSLTETSDGYVFRKKNDRITYEYNTDGMLVRIRDIHNNCTELMYSGRILTKLRVSSGQWIEFKYADGRVCELEDNAGRRVKYTYKNNLLHTASLPNGGTMSYEYTAEGYITRATDLNGKWYSQNHFDRKGRVIRQELSGGEEYVAFYDDKLRQNTFLTTADGNSTIYFYGKENLPDRIVYSDKTEEERHYDFGHHVIYERDRLGREIYRQYDSEGMLLEEIYQDGLIKNYEYDEKKQLIRVYDNTGREIFNEYDRCGNLICVKERIDDEKYQATYYSYDSRGRVLTVTNANGSIEKYEYELPFSGAARYTTASGAVINYEYDNLGRLMSVEDELGMVSYGYNNFGQRTIIRDAEGNITRFFYDSMANLTKEIHADGYDERLDDGTGTVYEYDVWENLTKLIKPDGGVFCFENNFHGDVLKEYGPNEYGKENPRGRSYEYDADHNRIKTIYPDGGVLREKYDACGNLIKRILPREYDALKDDGPGYTYEYDCRNRLVQIKNSFGIVIRRYVYDKVGNLVKDIDAKGYMAGDEDEKRIGALYKYNFTGRLISARIPMRIINSNNSEAKVQYRLTIYNYDNTGNRIEEKRFLDYQTKDSACGRSNSIRYTYDSAGRLIRVNDSTGACIEYAYNGKNLRTMEKRKISDNVYQERYYFYSPAGRIIKIMDSSDEKGCGRKYVPTLFSYDKAGNIVRIQTPSGNEIFREYDLCGRLVSERHKEKNGSINDCITYKYDKADNVIERSSSAGYFVKYSYDIMNRIIRTEDSNGGIATNLYDLNGCIVGKINPQEYALQGKASRGYRFSYDLLGRNIKTVGPDGNVIRNTEYNSYGEILHEGDGTGGISYEYDFAGRRTYAVTDGGSGQKYEYDASGNIIGITDGNGNHIDYSTDLWGRITKITRAGGDTELYDYDCAGNMVKATDGNGNITCYEYNAINHVASKTDASGLKETYTYDMEGRIREYTDRDGRRNLYCYNMYGNPILHENRDAGMSESWQYDRNGLLKSAIGGGMRYEYEYYNNGLLKEKRASGRKLIEFAYDLEGRKIFQKDLTGRHTDYIYDSTGRLSRVMDNGRCLARYTYNADGTMKGIRTGENLYTDYSYDTDRNITGIRTVMNNDGTGFPSASLLNMKDSKTVLADNMYTYDSNGNITEKRNSSGITRYSYDFDNRLVQAEYPVIMGNGGITETFSYDAAGNRTGRISGKLTETYRYDNLNRLCEITSVTEKGADVTCFTYDKQGNMLTDGRNSYTYDGFGRMSEAASDGCIIQRNRYDAEGLRHEMEENGQLVRFLYSSGREVILEECDENIIRYIRGYGIISSDSEQAKTYYHYVSDEHGSITHIIKGEDKDTDYGAGSAEDNSNQQTGSTGSEILNTYSYDAFGNTIICEETVQNRFRYNGEQYDSATCQYYLRARYYNPVIGRFTQEDTYYGDGLNLYAYCSNNPVFYSDPSGHCAVEQDPYKRWTDVGADADTARLAAEAYPDASSKAELYRKYKEMGYNAQNALMLADYEIINGTKSAEHYAQNNVKKTDGATSVGKCYESGSNPNVNVDSYYNMTHDSNVSGQAHHLSQDAAFRDVIPTNDGLCVELEGNAFVDIGSGHYEAHKSMEAFWNQYRRGGDLYGEIPTIGTYNSALYNSLKAGGLNNKNAAYAVRRAYVQQMGYGLSNIDLVPRIPGRINQRK